MQINSSSWLQSANLEHNNRLIWTSLSCPLLSLQTVGGLPVEWNWKARNRQAVWDMLVITCPRASVTKITVRLLHLEHVTLRLQAIQRGFVLVCLLHFVLQPFKSLNPNFYFVLHIVDECSYSNIKAETKREFNLTHQLHFVGSSLYVIVKILKPFDNWLHSSKVCINESLPYLWKIHLSNYNFSYLIE